MPRYCPRCGEALHGESTTKGEVRKTARRAYEKPVVKKAPRKVPASSIAFGKAFKAVQHRFKKKGGGWKKDGFKNAAKAARKSMK